MSLSAAALRLACLAGFACLPAAPPGPAPQVVPSDRSCATFVLDRGGSLLVGHNLDESPPMRVPGLLVVNPRGLAKENRTYGEIKSGGPSASASRITWVSKFGSITYNVFGREFPDGGMNEAGLYVGEMTLMTTQWPEDSTVPRLYHHQWIQYLLDNFATVDEALASLARALPEGHCRWHFLLADKAGNVAVVEFLKGKPVVYRGASLPYPVLCNDPYDAELADIKNYSGFGGAKKPEPHYEREDPRFRWASVMIKDCPVQAPGADYAFAILSRLDMGTTKWSLVYDPKSARVYFRTHASPKTRWVDFSAFGFACTTGPLAVDIGLDRAGDVARLLTPLDDARNERAIEDAWAEIDAGFFGNLLFKPFMVRGLSRVPGTFACAPGEKQHRGRQRVT